MSDEKKYIHVKYDWIETTQFYPVDVVRVVRCHWFVATEQ